MLYVYKDRKRSSRTISLEKPTTKIAKDFGVSDKAIDKLCKKLDVENHLEVIGKKLNLEKFNLITVQNENQLIQNNAS